MFEQLRHGKPSSYWDDDSPELDVDALYAAALESANPHLLRHFEDDPGDWSFDPAALAELEAMPSAPPERIYLEEDRPLYQRDPDTYTDAEAITRLVQVEAEIADCHALRARLVALVAAQRPASADRPVERAGARAANDPAAATGLEAEADVVPEVLEVSEWLAHELQMAHPYSLTAAQDLVETSLVLSGRLIATLALLEGGRIDYRRAHILTDLLGTCSVEVAHTVEAMVLPRAPGLTPGGLATAVRRALAIVDAAALRRRNARTRKTANVGHYPTQDGMARLFADLPLPVAAACCDAIGSYAHAQRQDGDDRPIGQIRTEVLTDLILRPWDASRPAVTAEVTLHLTIPTTTGSLAGAVLDEQNAEAQANGEIITAAQCRELLTQLESSRLFLALHNPNGALKAVASPARLRRAARRRTRKVDGPGLRPPPPTSRYRPTRELDRHVRTRDRTCRHFGCTRKAVHADIDHHHRWPVGKTAVCNLCCYCRTHHRLKHQAPGWTRQFHPDGTLQITTPTGNTRTTRPPGMESPLTVDDLQPVGTPPSGDVADATSNPESSEDYPPPF